MENCAMIREHEEPITAEAAAGDHFDNFVMSPLGKRLMEIRRKFIAEGGKLLSREELDQEIAERRGGYQSCCDY
jgi:hypothetical protein